jgi:hypothetical protein
MEEISWQDFEKVELRVGHYFRHWALLQQVATF